jgi:DNA repair protein RadC
MPRTSLVIRVATPTTPSRDDLEMTAQVREAAELLNVALRDHVIVGNGKLLSFHEAGLI